MKEGYISKSRLGGLRRGPGRGAARSTRPARRERRCVSARIGKGDAVCLDRPAHSAPKGVIYPQSETLFTFGFTAGPDAPQKTRVSLDAETAQADAVILAARPCDARGFALIDRVFLEADPYYRQRRERTTIIALACPKSYAGCFCTSVGGGPADKAGADVLATELEDGYYMDILTEKGAHMLADSRLEDGAPHRDEAKKRQGDAADRVDAAYAGSVRTDIRPELFASDEF